MQTLQHDVLLGKTQIRQRSPSSLISVFAEEALGSWLAYSGRQGLWQDCTEVQAEFLLGLQFLIIAYLFTLRTFLFVLTSSLCPAARTLVTFAKCETYLTAARKPKHFFFFLRKELRHGAVKVAIKIKKKGTL